MTGRAGRRTWSDDLRRLRRRLAVAYTVCPIVLAVTVIVGRDHRLLAAVMLWATFLATHLYVLGACLWTLLLRPSTTLVGIERSPEGDAGTG